MSGSANVLNTLGAGRRTMLPLAYREKSRATGRLHATSQLIAPPCEVVLPGLEKVPTEQRFSTDDREVIGLAEIWLRSGIAGVKDWEESGRDPVKYLFLTLQRWIRDHGRASIQRRFDLDLTLSDRLVDYSDERGPEGTLYLILDPDSAAFVLLNPTLELLGRVHPRLPATFFGYFVGSLNRWVRVYDYHDAEERVDMLREWYEDQANPEQYEAPDIEACTPQCLKEQSLSLRALKDLNQRMRNKEVRVLVSSLLELCSISREAKRPEFTEDMGEQLMDSNPPLPCLLAAFSPSDSVVGCFDDESQTAMETTPQPNLIVPLRLSDPASVRQGFRTLAVVCETLAAACRLIDLMPGNNDGVIVREEQS
jgi:hypothetical protein